MTLDDESYWCRELGLEGVGRLGRRGRGIPVGCGAAFDGVVQRRSTTVACGVES